MDENTAAIAMLLTAAAQMAETPAPASVEPVSIDDLNDLHRQKAEVEQKLAEIERKLQAMQNQLKGISEEKANLVCRQREIQEQAAKLCEALFGIGITPQIEQPQPTSPVPAAAGSAALRKLDNSIVIDKSAPTPITPMPQDAAAEVNAVQKLGGFSF